jgi:hypothetical protein
MIDGVPHWKPPAWLDPGSTRTEDPSATPHTTSTSSTSPPASPNEDGNRAGDHQMSAARPCAFGYIPNQP